MVGRGGLEPPLSKGTGFTVRGDTNYALPTRIYVDTAAGIDPANLQAFRLVSNRYLFISMGFGCFASINYTVIFTSFKLFYILLITTAFMSFSTVYTTPIAKNTFFCSYLFISSTFHKGDGASISTADPTG